jgi:hypothetical protein
MYVRVMDFARVSKILRWDFQTVLTVWYFLLSFHNSKKKLKTSKDSMEMEPVFVVVTK